ncbi:MAG: integrin [Bryobacterales bacterium]|nr:integrin [Bryobacterales bacterium]
MKGRNVPAVLLVFLAASAITSNAQSRQLRQTSYLKASNTEAGDRFGSGGALEGHAVAISGDGNTIAVGAPVESSNAKGINGNQNDNSLYRSGAVYIFTRSGNGFAQQAYLKASNPGQSDMFGYFVGLSADGNTMAVSAPFESSGAKGINGNQDDNSVPQAGAVYIFTRSGTTWSQQAYVKASNTGEAPVGDQLDVDGDQFGFSISLSDDGNTLAAGAIAEDSAAKEINGNQNDNSAASAGAVYVFARSGNAWSQQAYVKSSNIGAGDIFGHSVSLSADGNTLAVGASEEDGATKEINGPPDDRLNGPGAVYVFTRAGGSWSQQAYVKASNTELMDSFGTNVALSDDGNTLASSSLDEDCLLTGVNPPGCDKDGPERVSSGMAFVFVRNGTTWTQQAVFKASNSGKFDWFGARLALSGDGNIFAVGAQIEDSAAQGINGRQDDDSGPEAGVVYFFTRTGATWSQQAYVKGSNTEAFDEFGSSLSLSRDGRTMVVGAQYEDGAAKGVNGNQAGNSALDSGAVYVFAY